MERGLAAGDDDDVDLGSPQRTSGFYRQPPRNIFDDL
jgi:hypothetical protein